MCIIHPIALFSLYVDMARMTYNFNFGRESNVVGYVWYIEGEREKILVDAGGDVDYLSKTRGLPCKRIQTIEAGLDKLGLSLNDIDLIIQTHLHSDHVALGSKYPKARILVQRKELDFAKDPHPVFKSLYVRRFFECLDFEVIDGDTRVSENISVLLTPGHSPGSQSVKVETDQGTAIIAGFCSLQYNFHPRQISYGEVLPPIIPPHVHTNLLEAYDSMRRIQMTAGIILPLHEPEFISRTTIP